MKVLFFKSLKLKVILSIVAVILSFGALATYFSYTLMKTSISEIKREDILDSVITQSHETSLVLLQSKDIVDAISNQEDIIKFLEADKVFGSNDLEEIDRINERLESFNIGSRYSAIYLMDANGSTVASTNESFLGKNYSFRGYFINAIEGDSYSDISIGVTSKELGYYFSSPIYSNEEVIGIAVVKMIPSFVHETISDNVAINNSTYMLVDKYGIVIYSNNRQKEFKSIGELDLNLIDEFDFGNRYKDIEIEALGYDVVLKDLKLDMMPKSFSLHDDHDQREELFSVVALKDFPFYIISEVENKDILEIATNSAVIIAYLVIIAAFSASVLTSILVNKMLLPVDLLKVGAEEIVKGNYNYNIDIATEDEFSELAQTFNIMVDQLKASHIEITKQVEAQTLEIVKKTEILENQQLALLNILEDVEKEKAIVEIEKEKVNAILYSIGDGVLVINLDFKITLLNETAAKIAGFSMKDSVGIQYEEFLKLRKENGTKGRGSFIKKAIKSDKTQLLPAHYELITKDQAKISLAATASPLHDQNGDVIGCVVVFRDISKERAIDRSKSEFVSLASHQLRTPLSTIGWYTEMLLAGDAGKLNKEQKEYLEQVYSGNQRMVDLVNALLNVSRLDLGTFIIEPEPMDITQISKNAIAELTALTKTKKIKIKEKYVKLPLIELDKKLTHIIFQNLLSNAVKYSPDNSTVKVDISKDKKNIIIAISDKGMGIPKRQQDKLFTKLFRADNAKHSDAVGTGLGLYIVKQILDNAKGTISVESEENKGTTFIVKIPLKGMKKKKGTKALS